MRPLIGITAIPTSDPADPRGGGNFSLYWNYPEAVAKAGGVPVILPCHADPATVMSLIDGWLIPGGIDMDASHYGEENHPACELQDPSRIAYERRLWEAMPTGLPVLGICYGAQFINVLHGGGLEQHIPDRKETADHVSGAMQTYGVEPGSRLAHILGSDRAEGRSFHHQAIDHRIGSGLRAVAWHEDSTVEAIEGTGDRWIIGLQWHPERSMGSPTSDRIFDAFVVAAARYQEAKHGVQVPS
ncbi:MAG: putative glutamine amidotransferase [Fimbriimonadaceae bacterium]|nr:putative glutamine amidotransferase [Fimbriimonadaceae bacterium]